MPRNTSSFFLLAHQGLSDRLEALPEVVQGGGIRSIEQSLCVDFCKFADSLCVLNTAILAKGDKPVHDPMAFINAIEVMQQFMAFKGLHSS